MFCSKCGAEIKEGHKFCMNCGAPVAPRMAQPAPKAPEVSKTPKAPKQPKAPKVQKVESEISNTETPKKKGKAGTVVLIIVAAVLVVAIALIVMKLVFNNKPEDKPDNNADWEEISDNTQIATQNSTASNEVDALLEDQLQQILSEKGDIRGESRDLCKGKNVKDLNGVVGSAVLDVSGDGVDDLIVAYIEKYCIYADVYSVEDGKIETRAERLFGITGFGNESGCDMLSGIYLKETSDGWNLVADSWSIAMMFSDGVGRDVRAVTCKNHTYDAVGDFSYAGSDCTEEDYEEGNQASSKMGMSGVTKSLEGPYFMQDQDVTLIAASHVELLAFADTMKIGFGEKYGTIYVDKVDATDSAAASSLVDAYKKYDEKIMKDREQAYKEASDYILPMSNERKLTAEDLEDIKDDAWLLKVARNEIYARYGRKFKDDKLQEYFNGKDWYVATYSIEDHPDEVSDIETYNAKFIQKYEEKLENE